MIKPIKAPLTVEEAQKLFIQGKHLKVWRGIPNMTTFEGTFRVIEITPVTRGNTPYKRFSYSLIGRRRLSRPKDLHRPDNEQIGIIGGKYHLQVVD